MSAEEGDRGDKRVRSAEKELEEKDISVMKSQKRARRVEPDRKGKEESNSTFKRCW